jgi:hypothetical protein
MYKFCLLERNFGHSEDISLFPREFEEEYQVIGRSGGLGAIILESGVLPIHIYCVRIPTLGPISTQAANLSSSPFVDLCNQNAYVDLSCAGEFSSTIACSQPKQHTRWLIASMT